jgi:hypothetical protein
MKVQLMGHKNAGNLLSIDWSTQDLAFMNLKALKIVLLQQVVQISQILKFFTF